MEIINELRTFLAQHYATSEDLANIIKSLYVFTNQTVGNFHLKFSDRSGNKLEITTELVKNASVDSTLLPHLEKLLTLVNTKYNKNYIADFICANTIEMCAYVTVTSNQLILPVKYELELEIDGILKREGIIEDQ